MSPVPRDHWGEYENAAPTRRLDLAAELARWGGVSSQSGGRQVEYEPGKRRVRVAQSHCPQAFGCRKQSVARNIATTAWPLTGVPSYAVIHPFQSGGDGDGPQGSLARDRAGNLYGATAFGGDGGCVKLGGCGRSLWSAQPWAGTPRAFSTLSWGCRRRSTSGRPSYRCRRGDIRNDLRRGHCELCVCVRNRL